MKKLLAKLGVLGLLLLLTACPSTTTPQTSVDLKINTQDSNLTIEQGESINLTWGITNPPSSPSCELVQKDLDSENNEVLGNECSGAITLSPEKSTSYTLRATTNQGGEVTDSLTVTVTPPTINPPSIEGIVYEDSNENGQQDAGETGLANRTVYLDANANRVLDAGETSTSTDENGNYAFSKLEPGTYTVRQVLPFGSRQVTGGDAVTAIQSIASFTPNTTKQLSINDSHIVGGVDADISAFPFMAGVGGITEDGFFEPFCGGTLVSDKWVLTAAHCSTNADNDGPIDASQNSLGIMLGDSDKFGEAGVIIPVVRVVNHPNFDYEKNVYGGFDVSLWELKDRVPLTGDRFTSDLLTADKANLTSEGTLATATGWGALFSGGPAPDILQVVHVPISNDAACETAYTVEDEPNFTVSNTETMICASVPEGGIDACQGDSGGPLFVKNNAGDGWYQAGVTSFGTGCADPNFPGVYARVSNLESTIKSIISEVDESLNLAYSVTLEANSMVTAKNFGNKATIRSFTKTIEPRWQVTNFAPSTQELSPTSPVTYNWGIIDEGTSNFTCIVDLDGPGDAPPTNVPCQEGENTFTTATTYAEGVYLPNLTVSKGSSTQERERFILVGDPVAATQSGELTTTDSPDPNYDETYYIDYYTLDLTGIDEKTIVYLQLESEFFPYFALYDPATFSQIDGGEELFSGGFDLLIRPEDRTLTRYIVGVSTFDPEDVGQYILTTSNGTFGSF